MLELSLPVPLELISTFTNPTDLSKSLKGWKVLKMQYEDFTIGDHVKYKNDDQDYFVEYVYGKKCADRKSVVLVYRMFNGRIVFGRRVNPCEFKNVVSKS